MALDRNIFSIPNNERSIDSFKSRLVQGGARPNLFEVEMDFPSGVGIFDEEIENTRHRMMIKGAQLPASNIAEVVVPFRGRQIKIAGDRTFDEWSITVLNDTNFKLRNAFERWQNGINNMTDNEGLTNPVDYQVDCFVDHLDRNGNTIKSYTLRGLFPTAISAIDLNYDEAAAVEEFTATFNYQYFESNTTT